MYSHTHRSITFDSINNEMTKMSRCYLERRIQRHDDLTQKHRKLTTIPPYSSSDINTTAEALVASMTSATAANAEIPKDSLSETSGVVHKILNKAPEALPPGTQ